MGLLNGEKRVTSALLRQWQLQVVPLERVHPVGPTLLEGLWAPQGLSGVDLHDSTIVEQRMRLAFIQPVRSSLLVALCCVFQSLGGPSRGVLLPIADISCAVRHLAAQSFEPQTLGLLSHLLPVVPSGHVR